MLGRYTGHRKDRETLADYFQAFKLMDSMPSLICEFGVDQGGSLKLWNDLFSPELIIGLDCHTCPVTADNIRFITLDQRDKESIKSAAKQFEMMMPVCDLFIDDCCHDGRCVQDTMAEFWKFLRPGGLFVVEDIKANETMDWLIADRNKLAEKYKAEVFLFDTMLVFKKVLV